MICNIKEAVYTYVPIDDEWQVSGQWKPCGGSLTPYARAINAFGNTIPQPSNYTLGCGESVTTYVGGSTSGASCP